MRSCRLCGFPRPVSRNLDWRSDGTIIGSSGGGPRARACFLEPAELEDVFDDISRTMGMPLDSFLVSAQKKVGKAILENLPVRHAKYLPMNSFFRPEPVVRMLAQLVAGEMAALGGGKFAIQSYVPGERAVIRVMNPVLIPRQVGNAIGVYEALEGLDSTDVEYAIEDDDLVIVLRPGEERQKEEADARLYLEEVRPGTGWLEYERCTECGVPLGAAEMFSWDVARGVIQNADTGRREVVIAEQSIEAVMRELERELGEEITRHLYEHQKAQSRRRLEVAGAEEDEDFWDDYIEELALRGLGFPESWDRQPGAITVTTGSTYNLDLYAAKVAAAIEAVEGGDRAIQWLERQGSRGTFRISTDIP